MKVLQSIREREGAEILASSLGVLALVFILLTAGTISLVRFRTMQDQHFMSYTGSLKGLAQQFVTQILIAQHGKPDAFERLVELQKEFEQRFRILRDGPAHVTDPAGQVRQRLERIGVLWKQVSFNPVVMSEDATLATRVLADQIPLIRLFQITEQYRQLLPVWQRNVDESIGFMQDAAEDPRKLILAGHLSRLIERSYRELLELQRGLGDLQGERPNVDATLAEIEATFQKLLQGERAENFSSVKDRQALARLDEVSSALRSWRKALASILGADAVSGETGPAALVSELDRMEPLADQLIEEIDLLLIRFDHLRQNRTIKDSWALGFGLLSLLCLIFRSVVTRQISRRRINEISRLKQALDDEARQNQLAIEQLLEEMQGLSKGDLTVHASVGAHFTGAIAQTFNSAIDALRQLVATIIETTAQVSSSAQETQSTAIYLAEASEHQFEQITTVSDSISAMATSIEEVSRHADESADVAQQSVDLSLKGAETVRNAIEGMDTIREQIQETSKRIKRLGESSQEIGNIVELINDIADQTNILALNASIQAAMAGDAGRGFAVVADEVHRLAERSGDATRQIEALVKTIQTDTHEAVISMEQSTAGVVSGARLTQDAAEALHAIENVSLQLAELVKTISGSAKEQVSTTGEISQTMRLIQEITSQTLAGTNETANAIGHLAELISELRESVAGFKLPGV